MLILTKRMDIVNDKLHKTSVKKKRPFGLYDKLYHLFEHSYCQPVVSCVNIYLDAFLCHWQFQY